MPLKSLLLSLCACLLLSPLAAIATESQNEVKKEPKPLKKPLAIGDKARDFTLKNGKMIFVLKKELEKGPVVLLVLRGFPGYQCPVCSKQVDSYLKEAKEFAKLNSQVVMIYPGDVENLSAKAKEFLGKRKLPKNFRFLIDDAYGFTNPYALRWDAPRETAYPSTFVFDSEGVTRLAVVSRTHRGRTTAQDALKVLREIEKEKQESGKAKAPTASRQ